MLGKNILKLRKKAGLSQEELGDKINVTRQTISNWELNETTPNPDQLKLLSKVFNISVDELLDNNNKGNSETEVSNKDNEQLGIKNKENNIEKLAGTTNTFLKLICAIIVFFILIFIVLIILYSVGIVPYSEITSSTMSLKLHCTLNSKEYNYNIEYDNDNNILSVDNTDYYDFLEDGEFITDASILDTELTDYFTRKGGTCD